ncbi:MAG TPA: oxidoreductase [Treponema sp.]|nr:oxidoreductase [Treponema sp.]
MNIAVIGLGSMGKRRVRLISLEQKGTVFGVESDAARRRQCEEECAITCYGSMDALRAEHPVDCAFVCTSPLSHHAIIKDCLQHGEHVFTEINLVKDGYGELMELSGRTGAKLFLSSTPLYSREVSWLRNTLRTERNLSYLYHIGQYLPDWHPWESYKHFFVADARTNACREIFAIELPWLAKVYGKITDISFRRKKASALDVPYDDVCFATVMHENGNSGMFCVDVVSRKAVHTFETFNENLHVFWNGTPESFSAYNTQKKCLERIPLAAAGSVGHDARYADFIIEDDYLQEVRAFFDYIERDVPPLHTIQDDAGIIGWIDTMEGLAPA